MDVRLLTAVAETGRAAVPELAAHLGMDVREVAARLAALASAGLPLVVGVECDPNGIRNALAAAGVRPAPSGMQPPAAGGHAPGQPIPNSGNHPVHGGPSGGHRPQSGPYPAAPSGPHPAPSGPYTSPGSQPGASGPHPGGSPHQASPPIPGPPQPGAAGQAHPGTGPGTPTQAGTWGPPGSASWARADQAGSPSAAQPATNRSGKVGSKLETTGANGEQISIQLVEVVDPADFLYTAAGYTLDEGMRAIVVHTELTNRGQVPFDSLPDQYLVLVANDGSAMTKASVSLSSRPPHSTGVSPGQTAGGHTVFVLSEDTELAAVRWSALPGADQTALTWDISDL